MNEAQQAYALWKHNYAQLKMSQPYRKVGVARCIVKLPNGKLCNTKARVGMGGEFYLWCQNHGIDGKLHSGAARAHGKLTGMIEANTFGWEMALLLALGFALSVAFLVR